MTSISYAAIFEVFSQAVSNKLKFPKLRLQVGGETLVVKLAGEKSRYCGDIMLTNDAGFGSSNNKYYGRIVKGNGGLISGPALTPEVETFIQKFASDVLGTLQENGKLQGACCACQRALTDAYSVANGIGPVCQKKWFGGSRKPKATEAVEEYDAVVEHDLLVETL